MELLLWLEGRFCQGCGALQCVPGPLAVLAQADGRFPSVDFTSVFVCPLSKRKRAPDQHLREGLL